MKFIEWYIFLLKVIWGLSLISLHEELRHIYSLDTFFWSIMISGVGKEVHHDSCLQLTFNLSRKIHLKNLLGLCPCICAQSCLSF